MFELATEVKEAIRMLAPLAFIIVGVVGVISAIATNNIFLILVILPTCFLGMMITGEAWNDYLNRKTKKETPTKPCLTSK